MAARPFLSIAVLAYNEEATIEETVRGSSRALAAIGCTHEIMMVDDGSTDRTGAIMDRLAAEVPCARAVHHPRNLGIGAGVRTCFFESIGEWATFFPADMQADPAELPRLVSHLDRCDVLLTYREHAARTVSAA